jgi:hypothetical protein
MKSHSHITELPTAKTRNSRLLKIILVVSATFLCVVIAMLVITPAGSADAGIGQPVNLGPPQTFATGSGPYSIKAFSTGLEPGLAVVNNVSNSVSIIEQTSSIEGFKPPTNYALPAGAQPQAVDAGFRNLFVSGQRLVVVADTGLNKVSVLLQQSGQNTFQQPVNYDVGIEPRDIAIGRLNTDTDSDIVTANFGSNDLTVLFGSNNGTFGSAVSIPVSPHPRAVAVGPIDNDFTNDIVTCGNDAGVGKINVLFSISGTFQISGIYNVGSDPHDVTLADLNLDGKQDIVTANFGSNDVTVLLNDGTGGFSASASFAAGFGPRSVAVADFNRDGKPDLAIASAVSGLNLLLSNGDGTFAEPVRFSMDQAAFSVVTGLFNSDQLPDVATANNGDGTVSIRLNQTVPLLTFATPTPFTANSTPHSVAAFNRFGKPALAVTNNDPNDSGISVLYGVRGFSGYDGKFGNPTHYPLLVGSQPEQVVAGNLGQISIPSLVAALPNANKVVILPGNSDDTFQAPVYKDVGTFPRSITLADFNNDGNLDIAAANRDSNNISMLFGNADRTFDNAFTVANVLSASPEFIVSGDFNGDGKADVATCNSGTPDLNKVNVLMGNGNGSFQPMNVYTVGMNPTFMTIGDFNQDGKLDLAVSSTDDNKVSVLLNNGSGLFQAASHYAVGLHPNSITTGDLNLDGITDLVVTNGQSKTFSVLVNNGDGTFKNSLSFIVGPGPLGIAVSDFNFDGKPDVVTANHDDGTISIVLNSTPFPFPAPHNDNFANAEILSGTSGQTLGTNVGATGEANEGVSNSVWYSWTAPADGGMTIDTFESSFNTDLRVFTGSSLANVTLVAGNSDDFSLAGDVRKTSKVKFTAVAGTTYKISVFSFDASRGKITLNWSLVPPPANDNFANAQIISGASGVVTQTNAGATKEQGEPNHANNPGGGSIWFRWTAPASGDAVFNTSNSRINCASSFFTCRYDTLLAVYKGSTLQETANPLNLVAKNDNEDSQNVTSSVSFVATAGTTYQIAVDSKEGAKSDVVLSWFSGTAFNSSFGTAMQISGASGTTSSPVAPNGQAWFRWVAPNTGSVKFTSGVFHRPSDSAFQIASVLSISSVIGQTVGPLIGSNIAKCDTPFTFSICPDSVVSFNAVAGTVYAIQIIRPPESTGDASLSWSVNTPTAPANDNLAGAQVITGFKGTASFNNTNATKEPDEPNHGGNTGGHSVWFNWTAPDSFQVTFLTSPTSGQALFIGAYTGSTMAGLSLVNGNPIQATFNAVRNTTYRIAIDSQTQGSGSVTWRPTNLPSNDLLVNARVISGSSGKDVATNINATKEAGEPQHAGTFSEASIWYSWTAPSNGFFTFNTDGSDVDTVLAVYSRIAINNLSEVVSNADENPPPDFVGTSRVTFFALAGQVYKIAVAGSQGTIRLQWGAPLSIGGRVTNIRGVGIANVLITLGADGGRTRRTNSEGFYKFPDVPEGGTYTVTPSKDSYGYDVESRRYESLMSDVTDADFAASTPAYAITGRITAGGIPLPNIKVNLTGTASKSVLTNSLGAYEFASLPTNGNYTVTPSSPLFTFKANGGLDDKYFFTALNENKTGISFTAAAVPNVPELLLETSESPTTQAAALDAVLLVRDPFPVLNSNYLLFGLEQNTRVILFVRHLQLAQGETAANITVHMVDALGQTHDVAAEDFSSLPGFEFSQLIFRLPPTLAPGTYTIEIQAHGQASNTGTIRIIM